MSLNEQLFETDRFNKNLSSIFGYLLVDDVRRMVAIDRLVFDDTPESKKYASDQTENKDIQQNKSIRVPIDILLDFQNSTLNFE